MERDNLSVYIAGKSLLDREFQRALTACEAGGFVKKPLSLEKLSKGRRRLIAEIQESNKQTEAELKRRALAYQESGDGTITPLTAYDLASRSLLLQQSLRAGGALYGEKEFNFCVSDLRLPKSIVENIGQTGLKAYQILRDTTPSNDIRFQTASEEYIEQLGLKPNGARVDIILTEEGPKVIEINLQWVDAIQALEGFQETYMGQKGRYSPSALMAEAYKGRKRLAILELSQGAGTRSIGAKRELEALAGSLVTRNFLSEVEVLDPRKTLPRYLSEFDAFFINGEPKMITNSDVPEWVTRVFDRVSSKSATMFPNWRPLLDKKINLVQASESSDLFTTTLPFSEDNLQFVRSRFGRAVIKGDGFSSNNVALEGNSDFLGLLEDAKMFPQEYVVQPKMVPVRLDPLFAYDTSSSQPVYLPKPQSKFNVWIINDKLAGVLASISNSEVISDKDFNVIPKQI